MKHFAILILFLLGAVAAIAQPPADYPLTVDSQGSTVPTIEVIQGEQRTFLVTFKDGTNVSDVSSATVFMGWSSNWLSATPSFATSQWAKVNTGTGGQVRFTFLAQDIAPSITSQYRDVQYRVGAGVTYKLGTMRVLKNFGYSGNPTTNFVMATNLAGITFLNAPWVETVSFNESTSNNVVKSGTGLTVTFKTNYSASGGGSTSTLYRVSSASALLTVANEYGPSNVLTLSSDVATGGQWNAAVAGASNLAVAVSNQLLAASNALAAVDATALATNLTRGTIFTGAVRGVWNDLQLQAGTVASSNIIDATIATADIADDAVNGDKIAADSILSTHISDGEIENADIGAAAAIAMSKIAGLAALSNNFVTATGTLATVVASDALKLTSSHWASADSTTNYVRRTGDTMSGNLIMTNASVTNAWNIHATGVVHGAQWRSRYSTNTTTYAVIGGGIGNKVTQEYATIGGGRLNVIEYSLPSDSYATVGGGQGNTIGDLATHATVGGGQGNAAGGSYATVGGGLQNSAQGVAASIGGGYSNSAAGTYSFAVGQQARATHDGSFVWADSVDAAYTSRSVNSVSFRAGGGFWLTETMAFNGSGKLQSGVTTNTGSDGDSLIRSGTNVYWSPAGAGATNLALAIGAGATNYANTVGASVGLGATNLAIAIGAGATNISLAVGAGNSNLALAAYAHSSNNTAAAWSGVAATQTVNMAGNAVTNLNRIGLVGQTNIVPIRGDLFASNGVVYFVGSSGSASAQYGENNLAIGNYQTIASAQAAATNYARWLGNSPPTSNTANGSHMEVRMNQTNIFIYNVASGKWFRITGSMEWP